MPRRSNKNTLQKQAGAAAAAAAVQKGPPAPAAAVPPEPVKPAVKPKPKGGPRVKKKKTGANLKRAQKIAKEKPPPKTKKAKEEVIYDDSDPTKMLPVGLKLFCQYQDIWHEVSIIETKEKHEQVTLTMLDLPDLPGIPGIPGMSTALAKPIKEELKAIPEKAEEEEAVRPILSSGWDGEPVPSPSPSPEPTEGSENTAPAEGGAEGGTEEVKQEDEGSGAVSTTDPAQEADEKPTKGKKRKATSKKADSKEPHKYLYYIHFIHWDRRMDTWVERDRLALKIRKPLPKIKYVDAGAEHDVVKFNSGIAIEDDEEGEEGVVASGKDAHKGGGNAHGHGAHGNMTEEEVGAHEAATKVKNVDKIVLGKFEITTWYYSPFPEEYNQYSTLYFCEFCLKFFGYESELHRHAARCKMRHPPGNEVYRSKDHNVTICVFEIDGQKEILYCQSLSLIAKLFLDHKTVEHDCFPFLYYVVCEVDSMGCHIVGYFSKEKVSAAKYNLACILTLPCHQRKGYGKFIISFSYQLSQVEEKAGSPEKPISDLGKVSYMSYWTNTLVTLLNNKPYGAEISVDEISKATCIITPDIIETLKFHKILVWYKGKWTFSTTRLGAVAKLLEQKEQKEQLALKENPDRMRVYPCQPDKLHWTPYYANKRARHAYGKGAKGGKGHKGGGK